MCRRQTRRYQRRHIPKHFPLAAQNQGEEPMLCRRVAADRGLGSVGMPYSHPYFRPADGFGQEKLTNVVDPLKHAPFQPSPRRWTPGAVPDAPARCRSGAFGGVEGAPIPTSGASHFPLTLRRRDIKGCNSLYDVTNSHLEGGENALAAWVFMESPLGGGWRRLNGAKHPGITHAFPTGQIKPKRAPVSSSCGPSSSLIPLLLPSHRGMGAQPL